MDDSSAEAHVSLGGALAIYDGDWSGSAAHFERAMHLSPDYATAYHWHSCFGYTVHGQKDAAIRACRRALVLDSGFFRPHLYMGRAYAHLGHWDQAFEALQQARSLSQRDSRVEAALGFAFAAAGRRAEALELLGSLQNAVETRYISPCETAIIAAGLDDRDMIFEWPARMGLPDGQEEVP